MADGTNSMIEQPGDSVAQLIVPVSGGTWRWQWTWSTAGATRTW